MKYMSVCCLIDVIPESKVFKLEFNKRDECVKLSLFCMEFEIITKFKIINFIIILRPVVAQRHEV